MIGFKRVSLGVTVRLLHCDMKVTCSNLGNSLSEYKGKVAHIEPSPDPAMARASCTGPPFKIGIVHFLVFLDLQC